MQCSSFFKTWNLCVIELHSFFITTRNLYGPSILLAFPAFEPRIIIELFISARNVISPENNIPIFVDVSFCVDNAQVHLKEML